MRTWLSIVALGVGVALLAAALLHDEAASLPRVDEVRAAAGLDVGGGRFGDPVVAGVEVLVPAEAVDPESIRVDASFAPFALAGPPALERRDGGPTTLLRWRYRLECLERACLPREAGLGVVLPPATVRFVSRSGRAGAVTVGWPQVRSATWLGGADAGLLGWRADLAPLPAFDYRIPPRPFAVLLALVAVALAAAGAALLWPAVRRAVPHAAAPADRRSVLDRALAAVRAAAGGDDAAERRRALDLLARELRRGARRDEAGDARRLAWSRSAPMQTEMDELADRVEGVS
ncbi:MAG TPA: hypothetical protein VFR43_00930 [Gaiellaceae bacterium]|nr:hypothetical protein [Gaiellaceae bacterium]